MEYVNNMRYIYILQKIFKKKLKYIYFNFNLFNLILIIF